MRRSITCFWRPTWGYGLYCKNIEDALWIALINGLFSIDEMEDVKAKIEEMLSEETEESGTRSLPTMDLWVMLSQAGSLEQFYNIVRMYRKSSGMAPNVSVSAWRK